MTTPSSSLPPLPPRDPRGHKGAFGTVSIYGGCATGQACMIGAPALAAVAALRAGAGLARIVAPDSIIREALTIAPSATGVGVETVGGEIAPHVASAAIDACAPACDCLLVGPGMGVSDGSRAASLRAVQQEDVPVVIDADAINCLAQTPALHLDFHAAAVLTPHPGEYRRLAEALNIKGDPTDPAGRASACERLAQRLGCIVVLKGAGTVVSDGQRTWTNTTGSAVLATGGTGDVLAGALAGLIAQFAAPSRPAPMQAPTGKPLDLYNAARLAVHAHGRAAELWTRSRSASAGMLALELASFIPEALEQLRSSG